MPGGYETWRGRVRTRPPAIVTADDPRWVRPTTDNIRLDRDTIIVRMADDGYLEVRDPTD